MAGPRSRQPYQYTPEVNDIDSDEGYDLDEEEQERVIDTLQTQASNANRTYLAAFTIIPLVPVPVYVFIFLFTNIAVASRVKPASIRLFSLLCMTSLLASSFAVFFLTKAAAVQTSKSARERLSAQARHNPTDQALPASSFKSKLLRLENALDDLRLRLDREGPLLSALPWLNGVICVLLLFTAWSLYVRSYELVLPAYLALPGVMAAMVTFVQYNMDSEAQALDGLSRAKYGLKGA